MFVLVNVPLMDFINLTTLLSITDTFASSQMVSEHYSLKIYVL